MPEIVNTSALTFETDQKAVIEGIQVEDTRPTAIKVDHVSMVFNMASERLNNLKEYFLKIVKHQLFFEELIALDNITFEVKKGDVFGILGTNGSGKSTLLKIIAGVLEPSRGNVQINGAIAPLIELGAGFDMDLSARENIYLNGALLGYSREFIEKHFDEIVEFAEVEKFLDMPMKNYSSGMIARIAFAIATVIVPEILIVDEVLSVGDFMFQQKCEDRITELIEKHGVTVLIVSHSNDQIERLCNKAIWIEKGHTRIMGDAADVCSTYRILGGRTGSHESEEFIFNYLIGSDPLHLSEFEIFKSTNPFELSKTLVSTCWGNDTIENIMMVPDYTHVFGVVISPIAGALNAPVVPFERDNYVSTTFSALFSIKPSNAYIIAHQERARDMAADPWFEEIGIHPTALQCGADFDGINPAILEFGIEKGIWDTDIAFIVSSTEIFTSLQLASYSYSNIIPLIVLETSEKLLDNRTSSLLSTIGVKKLLTSNAISHSAFIADCRRSGFEVEEINEHELFREYSSSTKNALGDENSSLFVSSANYTYWNYLISVPSIAGCNNSRFLVLDDTKLDEVAYFLRLVANDFSKRIIACGNSNTLDSNCSFLTLLKRKM